jgi:hypothetical protein
VGKKTSGAEGANGGASRNGKPAEAIEQLSWRKACGAHGSCVEIAELPDGGTALRSSKDGEVGPVLAFSPEEWSEFVVGVKAGIFD